MTSSSGFQLFGPPHLTAMALAVALPVVLTWVARRSRSRGTGAAAGRIATAWGALLLANELLYWSVRIQQIGLDGWVRNHLPLHVCGVAVLLTAATLIFRSEKAYEIVYFWGLAGAANAVITPGELPVGFPEYRFFQYFVAHSGIVVGVLFATWSLGMRPTLRGLFRAFAALNLFALGVAGVNALLGSNYMFLSAPPTNTASPFFTLPWPWYLLLLEAVGLAMFFLVFSPFLFLRFRNRGANPPG